MCLQNFGDVAIMVGEVETAWNREGAAYELRVLGVKEPLEVYPRAPPRPVKAKAKVIDELDRQPARKRQKRGCIRSRVGLPDGLPGEPVALAPHSGETDDDSEMFDIGTSSDASSTEARTEGEGSGRDCLSEPRAASDEGVRSEGVAGYTPGFASGSGLASGGGVLGTGGSWGCASN